MATTIAVVGIVVAALAAGASAYMASEQQAQQARNQKKMARLQQEQEQAAGEARRRQSEYETRRKMSMFKSREAAAGVQIGEGSLLEQEMQFAADSDYAAQMAKYPYQLRANVHDYEGRIFGATEKRINDTKYLNTGIAVLGAGAAGGSTLATSYRGTGSGTTSSYGGD